MDELPQMPRPRIDPELERLLDKEELNANANPDLNSYQFRGEESKPAPDLEPLTDLEFGALIRAYKRSISALDERRTALRGESRRLERELVQVNNEWSRAHETLAELIAVQGALSNSEVVADDGSN